MRQWYGSSPRRSPAAGSAKRQHATGSTPHGPRAALRRTGGWGPSPVPKPGRGPRRPRRAARWLAVLCGGCVAACVAAADPPSALIDSANAFRFGGETTTNGACNVAVTPAAELGGDTDYTLRLTFRLKKHAGGDWLDCFYRPAPPLDCSASSTVRLWFRAEQPGLWPMVKIVDPDNPGANHSALETDLGSVATDRAAGVWHPLTLTLPASPQRRDDIEYVGFYIAAANEQMPLNEDVVFHVGKFEYVPPPRPVWPPPRVAQQSAATLVWDGALSREGPWVPVGGENNQTDHLASFEAGGVEFAADANGWNEFLWSDAEKLEIAPSTTYRLQFDYTVQRPASGGSGAVFYSLVRARGTIKEDVGWQRWHGTAGTRGRRIVTFTTRDAAGYYLNFGVRHHGAIRIENLRLWRVDR